MTFSRISLRILGLTAFLAMTGCDVSSLMVGRGAANRPLSDDSSAAEDAAAETEIAVVPPADNEPSNDTIADGDANQYCRVDEPTMTVQSAHASDHGGSEDDKKVLVCHVPPGNPAAAHNILISVNGWEHGHKGHHDDYLGLCGQKAATPPPPDAPPAPLPIYVPCVPGSTN